MIIGYGLVVLVVTLSLLPSTTPPKLFAWSDKLFHVFSYGVLMLWFAQLHPKSQYGRLACGFIALGILVEVLQIPVSTRSGDVWDVAANSLGTVLSWGLALMGMNTLFYHFENWFLKPRNEN